MIGMRAIKSQSIALGDRGKGKCIGASGDECIQFWEEIPAWYRKQSFENEEMVRDKRFEERGGRVIAEGCARRLWIDNGPVFPVG